MSHAGKPWLCIVVVRAVEEQEGCYFTLNTLALKPLPTRKVPLSRQRLARVLRRLELSTVAAVMAERVIMVLLPLFGGLVVSGGCWPARHPNAPVRVGEAD